MGANGERVSFLVNVWFNHRPSNCHRLLDSVSQYLGSASVERSLSPLRVPQEVINDPADTKFTTNFAWRTQRFALCLPLPMKCNTALLQWSDDAELHKA